MRVPRGTPFSALGRRALGSHNSNSNNDNDNDNNNMIMTINIHAINDNNYNDNNNYNNEHCNDDVHNSIDARRWGAGRS